MSAFIGHELGTYYRRDGIAYINIPKCASSSIKEIIAELEFEHSSLEETPMNGAKAFAVIRNPLTRFVSGMLEYHGRHARDEHLLDWLSFKYEQIAEGADVVLDEHTQPQYEFLEPFHGEDVLLIPFPFLRRGLEGVFRQAGLELPFLRRWNASPIAKFRLSLEVMPAGTLAAIQDYYARDWSLYQRCLHAFSS